MWFLLVFTITVLVPKLYFLCSSFLLWSWSTRSDQANCREKPCVMGKLIVVEFWVSVITLLYLLCGTLFFVGRCNSTTRVKYYRRFMVCQFCWLSSIPLSRWYYIFLVYTGCPVVIKCVRQEFSLLKFWHRLACFISANFWRKYCCLILATLFLKTKFLSDTLLLKVVI